MNPLGASGAFAKLLYRNKVKCPDFHRKVLFAAPIPCGEKGGGYKKLLGVT